VVFIFFLLFACIVFIFWTNFALFSLFEMHYLFGQRRELRSEFGQKNLGGRRYPIIFRAPNYYLLMLIVLYLWMAY